MKKLSLVCLMLVCCIFLNGFISAAPVSSQPDNSNAVLKARLENLLNQNTVYGEDFLDNQKLVNAAMIVLKGYADEDGFVKNEIVSAYIKDMYDINLDINEKINPDLPQKEGHVLLVPRGYSVYSHNITDIIMKDGYILVISNVVISSHDAQVKTVKAETKFIENEASIFGYSILDSVLSKEDNTSKI